MDKLEDLSDRESETRTDVSAVLVVIDVLVYLSSVVIEFCDDLSCCTEWEFVEPPSFSFSKKRAHSCTVGRDEVWRTTSESDSAI